MTEPFFRKASLDSITSPEQLNEYIKVSTPSVWIILLALIILFISVLVWGFAGSVPSTVSVPCTVLDDQIICYLTREDAARIQVGQMAWINGSDPSDLKGSVFSIGEIPFSASEIFRELKSEYLAQLLVDDTFAFRVVISSDPESFFEQQILNVKIVTESTRPIDFLFR